jgi:hypothetical protein
MINFNSSMMKPVRSGFLIVSIFSLLLITWTCFHVQNDILQKEISQNSIIVQSISAKNLSQTRPFASTPRKSTKLPIEPINPKIHKYEPPTGGLSTRPTGTLHPDSQNPNRTYNTEPPSLPQCHSEGDNVVSIYMESHSQVLGFFLGELFQLGTVQCNLPNDAECKFVNNDTLVDAVFRFVYFIDPNGPLRYCQQQTLIIFNGEALRGLGPNYQQRDLADIRIDHFLNSDIFYKEICLRYPEIYKGRPPADPTNRTKGVALFTSDCSFKWRYDYFKELMEYIHIDSYGKCFHNVEQGINEMSRFAKTRFEIVTEILQPYRMMLSFENIIQEDYITEKPWVAYNSGSIPVYLGPPDFYKWAPGNHTFIDPRNFSGPKELAEYMKRVAEEDDLFKYHTSNFDWDRTKRMMDKYCRNSDVECRMCQVAYERKTKKLKSAK